MAAYSQPTQLMTACGSLRRAITTPACSPAHTGSTLPDTAAHRHCHPECSRMAVLISSTLSSRMLTHGCLDLKHTVIANAEHTVIPNAGQKQKQRRDPAA